MELVPPLPFQAFEPIDLPFDLTLAPRQGARSINGLIILLHARGETFKFRDMAAFGCSDPILQRMCPALFEHVQEVLTEFIRSGELLTGLAHLLELPLLMSSELLWGEAQRARRLFERKAAGAWEQSPEEGEAVGKLLCGQKASDGRTTDAQGVSNGIVTEPLLA
ncbi:MAG TPA: hypothetical protein VKB35_07035 [Ktedonobacteraceae bacterium]|nr:hypothetical protein [Ktedonobacteraceae bacterium]